MYEIWLVLNILWEIALGVWPLIAAAGVAWVVLMALVLRRPARRWQAGFGWAVAAGIGVAVVTFLAVPWLTKSSLGQLSYWVDWANLLGIAAAVGVVAVAFVWPLAALRGGPTAR